MADLCTRCRDPGACCRAITLTGDGTLGPGLSDLELTALMAMAGFPFLPLWRHDDGVAVFWCLNLDRDGRCSDYAHRPQHCRDYEPGTGVVCAESPDRDFALL